MSFIVYCWLSCKQTTQPKEKLTVWYQDRNKNHKYETWGNKLPASVSCDLWSIRWLADVGLTWLTGFCLYGVLGCFFWVLYLVFWLSKLSIFGIWIQPFKFELLEILFAKLLRLEIQIQRQKFQILISNV